MKNTLFYKKVLGLSAPWEVTNVDLHEEDEEVVVKIEASRDHLFECPICSAKSKRYDHNKKMWRDKDSCHFKTIIVANIPRVNCPEHGVRTVTVPWAGKGSRYTYLFESYVINWLKEATVSAVARQINLGYDAIAGIRERAVKRGLKRRGPISPKRVAVDETNSKKGHNYLTVVSEGSRVLHVSVGRKKESLDVFWRGLTEESLENIESVSMDLWQAFRSSTIKYVPNAQSKICLDRFHVAGYFGKALDKVRKAEHKELLKEGNESLKGMKYQLLKSNSLVDNRTSIRLKFHQIIQECKKSSRAWAMKELQQKLWDFTYVGVAERNWEKLISWMQRSRIKPISSKSFRFSR